MRTVAGGCVINEAVYCTAEPRGGRENSPADLVAEFQAANSFECVSLRARISARQCEVNQARGMFVCGECSQRPAIEPKGKTVRDRRERRLNGWQRISRSNKVESRHEEASNGTVRPGMSLGKAGAGMAQQAAKIRQKTRGGGRSSRPEGKIDC